ncbi:MAG TPA: deoxyguanosinetriphosphate triphosphohydrolase [Firmicutes bacterium]|jgi:dGTPase|nr:deoxyguanosinetriphosphate triphosphohydrolase [Bacillota bacterium]
MVCPRVITEEWEERLQPKAARSRLSRGRNRPEEECPVRTAFQRDRDRIIHSKAFRRLKDKTQVFIAPTGDHFRTRLTHTLEVAQIARTVARALRLNEDLTEAIALAHDLGHTPFGHAGEDVLREIHPGGFEHNEQSLRVVDHLEQPGGLNLTWEVRDGILNHTGPGCPGTLEGQIVCLADRIAYINHDIDDAIRGGIIDVSDLPKDCLQVLGWRHSERIHTMVQDMIEASGEATPGDGIRMSPHVWSATERLRQFLFTRVYVGSPAKREEDKAKQVVEALYRYFQQEPQQLYGGNGPPAGVPLDRTICDYVAGMTDRYAIEIYRRVFLPAPWRD